VAPPHATPRTSARLASPALWASCLAMTLVYNNNGLVNVALPTIGRQLDADVVLLQWVVNAYALALGALMVTAGGLADRYGARRVVLTGAAVFAAGSTAAAAREGRRGAHGPPDARQPALGARPPGGPVHDDDRARRDGRAGADAGDGVTASGEA